LFLFSKVTVDVDVDVSDILLVLDSDVNIDISLFTSRIELLLVYVAEYPPPAWLTTADEVTE